MGELYFRKPHAGQTVRYMLDGGESTPAIVTKVHDDGRTVNLRVMLDVADVDRGAVPGFWTKEWLERTGYCPPEYAVRYGEVGEGGTWRHVAEKCYQCDQIKVYSGEFCDDCTEANSEEGPGVAY